MSRVAVPESVTQLFNWVDIPPREVGAYKVFTLAQQQYLNNTKIDCAMELLNITYKPEELESSRLRAAELQGAIHIIDQLIMISKEVELSILNPTSTASDNQEGI